ncbi:DUF2155 domain-containing protein [Pelagibacterium xiamenense]|uniref:DUF2155 domain-containing protein n=1 Tax=Pelagibacterium xiamenense TaxID=2901140 RepID=UPI001E603C9A|nr:DUF2155 domain-containing protein [Pelagibacterium xiamenense]MCD7061119.1 DUF2155 domain-containing protein [Pelagibacterium xiamenense]
MPGGWGNRRLGFRFSGWLAGALLALVPASVLAQPIANPVAVFRGLDKITGRITTFDVYIDETVQFGSLQLTPRVCHSRPASEAQKITAFVEVDEVSLRASIQRIFTGWMFAESPALNAIDDAVYDIWLIDCKQTSDIPPPDQR